MAGKHRQHVRSIKINHFPSFVEIETKTSVFHIYIVLSKAVEPSQDMSSTAAPALGNTTTVDMSGTEDFAPPSSQSGGAAARRRPSVNILPLIPSFLTRCVAVKINSLVSETCSGLPQSWTLLSLLSLLSHCIFELWSHLNTLTRRSDFKSLVCD